MPRRLPRILLLAPVPVAAALFLSSCAAPRAPYPDMEAPAPVVQQATTRVNGRAAPAANDAPGPIVRQLGDETVLGQSGPGVQATESGDVSLNYIDTDVRE